MNLPKMSKPAHAEAWWRTRRLATIQSVLIGLLVALTVVILFELQNRPTRSEVERYREKANGAVAAASSANGALSSAGLPTVSVPTSVAAPTETVTITGAPGRDGVNGLAGRGILRSEIQGTSLVLFYSDGSSATVGTVVGPAGATGAPGNNGANGKDGRGLVSAAITPAGHLVLTYTDGSTADVGPVVGGPGANGTNGTSGTDGTGVGGFTFTIPGALGNTTYNCTPDAAGTSVHYSCAAS